MNRFIDSLNIIQKILIMWVLFNITTMIINQDTDVYEILGIVSDWDNSSRIWFTSTILCVVGIFLFKSKK